MAEGVGFEPTVELPLLLISSQVPLTTQPPFRTIKPQILLELCPAASSFDGEGAAASRIVPPAMERRA
jgi:hypothetical protein